MQTIALDLDEVVFNFIDPFLAYVNEHEGTNHKREDLKVHSFAKSNMFSEEKKEYYLNKFTEEGRFFNLPLIDSANSYIHILKQHANICCITSRPKEAEGDTKNRLRLMRHEDIPVIFSTNGNKKYKILHEINANFFVDDHPLYIQEAFELGPKRCLTILFNPIDLTGALYHFSVNDWKSLYTIISKGLRS